MNFWWAQVGSRVRSSLLMVLAIFCFVGCKVEGKTWIDKMLSEMETAWIEADNSGGGQEARHKAIDRVAQKYFPEGMPRADAFKLLNDLKSHGFIIYEDRREGNRIWPDGDFGPYKDEATKRQSEREILQGTSSFTARKDDYSRERLIISTGVAIGVVIGDTDGVKHTSANIWASSI